MDIKHLPTISKSILARNAGVSVTRVNRALEELEASGKLERSKSPTGRELLSPYQSQMVLDAICGA